VDAPAARLGDLPVDIIDRKFMIEDLLEYREAPALMEPVLDAAAHGWVKISRRWIRACSIARTCWPCCPTRRSGRYSARPELTSLDRILPWTRIVRPGAVSLEDGRRIDLLGYALTHQRDLALKPAVMHGGRGVVLARHQDTAAADWEDWVRVAGRTLRDPVQDPAGTRPVPRRGREPVPWIVSAGPSSPYWTASAGSLSRALTVESNIEVINLGSGASVGGCLHVQPHSR
jgi:hypothetical protein